MALENIELRLLLTSNRKLSLSIFSLTTLLCEIEAVAIGRPIAYVADDINELEPSSPSHFLIDDRLVFIVIVK